ncbi:MAG: MATE family efflux transporter [Candidatus Neomarinimicrobiota bacterium]|nr:MATE family efflux transporter [Candidatus Neomarinimicrobiota bacterium]
MTISPEKESRLTEFTANPRRAMWTLATPMMIGMMVQTIYTIVDMIFVGKVSGDALTALAFNLPLLFFGLGLVFGLGSGVTAVIAQYIGAEDKRNADNSAEHAVLLGVFLGTILTLVGIVWGRELLSLLGTPEHILPLAWDYFRVIATCYLFLVLSIFFRSVLSGEGDMKTPMIIQGGGTVLNIILDPILIFGLEMGVQGAAVATVISQGLVALIFAYLMIVKEQSYITFSLRGFSFSQAILKKIFVIGLPASFSMIIMSIGGGAFNRILVLFSSEAVAGYQIGIRLDHVFLMPAISISTSLVTLVGMFYGAQRLDLVRMITSYAIKSCILVAVAIGGLFFVLAPEIVKGFSSEPAIRDVGSQYLRYFVFGYPFVAVSMISGRVLQGLGKGMPMLILTFMRVLLLSVALASYFVFVLGKSMEWVWISQVVAVAVSAVVATIWLVSTFRKLRSDELTSPESIVSVSAAPRVQGA